MKNFASTKLVVLASLIIILMSSCSSNNGSGTSRGTGWKINDPQGGFQFNSSFKEQKASPGLIFIQGGTFTKGKVQDDVMHDWNNKPTQQHVQSFFMDETEVTNLMYLEYLDWNKRVYPPSDKKYRAIYDGILPDTLVWRNRLGYNEEHINNYLRHPAYANYPVVGVTWIQAVEYSNWRTDRVAEIDLQNSGYLEKGSHISRATAESNFNTDTYTNAPTKTFGGNDSVINPSKSKRRVQVNPNGDTINVYAKRESGLIPLKYRLPTETEWEYAALGLDEKRKYNIRRGRKKYPWDGKYTRSGNRRILGDQLANFKQGKGDYGGVGGWPDDGGDITNQVKFYPPNDFGLYDMAGNVAEWVADVYRPIIDDEYNDFNYFRGNVYTKNAINNDGSVQIVTTENIVYDTLSNGKLIARRLPGEIAQVNIDENETYLRSNFEKSDNRNFRDGDIRSSRYFDEGADEDEDGADPNKSTSDRVYNAPKHLVERDEEGNIIREYDKTTNRTSLINDEVRVYKGGSWKDREYWLDPAQRRYYPQDKATDYIGFRCAMSRVGSKFGSKYKTQKSTGPKNRK